MRKTALLAGLIATVMVIPIAAFAFHSFTDVSDSAFFHNSVEWMKDNGITAGCNPPGNTNYCPNDNVSRGEMAVFLKRLAEKKVVDAATAVNADNATNADTLDGIHANELVRAESTAGPSESIGTSGSADVAPTTITTPAKGLLLMTATMEMDLGTASGDAGADLQFVRDGGTVGPVWRHEWELAEQRNAVTVHYAEVVNAGTYELALRVTRTLGFVNVDNPVVTVMWIAFGGDGLTPSGVASLDFADPGSPSAGDTE